jgi:hypothetical protein
MFDRSGHRVDVTPTGVIQQRHVGEPSGRIHSRPVVDSDDPFRCPTTDEATSALVMLGPRD